uniref:Uncharacterized protein n=1 Tax=Strombidinopsis acuminata TaxID=141414 RepID=A0A7S3W499_9SPIT
MGSGEDGSAELVPQRRKRRTPGRPVQRTRFVLLGCHGDDGRVGVQYIKHELRYAFFPASMEVMVRVGVLYRANELHNEQELQRRSGAGRLSVALRHWVGASGLLSGLTATRWRRRCSLPGASAALRH